MPNRRRLVVPGFGIIRSRTGSGRKLRAFNSTRSLEKRLDPLPDLHLVDGLAIHPSRARPRVAPHPIPGHQQEARIGDEVEQVIEPAVSLPVGPPVQLGLDLQYPAFCK